MSELISLREQVAQAELAVSGLVIDRAPASSFPSDSDNASARD
jgi:hypothetical protein